MKNVLKFLAAAVAVLSISAAANAAEEHKAHHGKHHGKKHEAAAQHHEAAAEAHEAGKSKVVDKK